MNKRLLIHGAVLGIVVAVTAAGRFSLRRQHAAERQEIAKRATEQRSREIEEQWKRLKYSEASDSKFPDAFVSKIDWRPLRLSDVQRTQLQSRLPELLRYLRDPGFDEYFRLKTEGLSHRFHLDDKAMKAYRVEPFEGENSVPQGEREAAHRFWEAVHRGTNAAPTKLTAFCLDQIVVARSDTNSVWSLIKGPVSKGFTVAVEGVDPGLEYAGARNKLSEESEKELFLHLSFFARAQSGNAGPVYASLQWLESDQQWAFTRLVTDVWLGVRTLF